MWLLSFAVTSTSVLEPHLEREREEERGRVQEREMREREKEKEKGNEVNRVYHNSYYCSTHLYCVFIYVSCLGYLWSRCSIWVGTSQEVELEHLKLSAREWSSCSFCFFLRSYRQFWHSFELGLHGRLDGREGPWRSVVTAAAGTFPTGARTNIHSAEDFKTILITDSCLIVAAAAARRAAGYNFSATINANFTDSAAFSAEDEVNRGTFGRVLLACNAKTRKNYYDSTVQRVYIHRVYVISAELTQ